MSYLITILLLVVVGVVAVFMVTTRKLKSLGSDTEELPPEHRDAPPP